MALKNKHHNFWTLWNFSGLWYSLTTACCRYFCRDLESYVNGNDWKWQIFLLCFPLERGQGAKQSNSYLMLIALYSPMQGDTLPSQRTNVSRRTIAHTLFPVVWEACASSPSFPSQNDPWLLPALLPLQLPASSAELCQRWAAGRRAAFQKHRFLACPKPWSRSSKQSCGSQAGPVERKEENFSLLRNDRASLVRVA